MVRKFSVSLFLLIILSVTLKAVNKTVAPCDRICGRWQSEKKNCIVQVYREDDDFKAKLVWFDDSDDPSKPMETRVDFKNPDKALRTRKLIGMNVLEKLEYRPKTDSWENGIIYDAQSGKKWNSAAYLTSDGVLKVTGYWHFKFIGQTMTFYKVQ
ncbi:DUF2147 domain-containing protein [Mucilaginibacter sp. PAMB04168]|uniref:DUF2147 domain-containing protein n=1 Tax=Mucilaginibacter sp. PAMB04168 TaxID=3138567 RepID=UPI0031F69EE9